MKFFLKIGCLSVLLAILSACSATRPRGQQYFDHEVKYQGETLSAIASWYTGHADDWAIILQHNPNINIYKLRRGSIVRIPLEMVIREDPFPKRLAVAANPVPGTVGQKLEAPLRAGTTGAVSADNVALAAGSAGADSSHTPALSVEKESEVRRKSREELFRELLPPTAKPTS